MPNNKLTKTELDTLKRSIIYKPCHSKEELAAWLDLFLNIQLPDCIVDPESNSCPMDLVWEIYSKALNNDDPSFRNVLAYSARRKYENSERCSY